MTTKQPRKRLKQWAPLTCLVS